MALFTSAKGDKTFSTVPTPKYKYRMGNQFKTYYSSEPPKGMIGTQAKIVEERGGTLIDNPKLNKALKDAIKEIKTYHKKIKVIHIPSFVDKHLGKNAQRREVEFFKSKIIPEIRKLDIVEARELNSFKALKDYQEAPKIIKGVTTPNIAKKNNISLYKLTTLIQGADSSYPGFRRKINLKFGNEAERKRAAGKKETAAQRKFSQATLEKFYAGPTGSGVQKSHMGDKFFTEVTARNLGYAPAVINQENLKEFDEKLRSLKKKQLRLIKNKPDGWRQELEKTNVKGMRVAAESGGYKTFETIDPYTLKKYEYGVDLKKTIDPLDLTEGATLKEINKSKTLKDLIELNRPMSIELQKQANKMLQSADKLTSREQLALCSLLSRGGLPGDCRAAIQDDPIKAAQIFDEAPNTSSTMQKVKNAATGFLNFAKRGGKFGALAAVGAAGAGLVKTFMNDDPTTYLSNEDQQKNMLISMITDPVVDAPQESPAILDYQLPVIGAGALAGTAAVAPSTIEAARSGALGAKKSGITKTGLKTLGRGLAALGTPAALLATEPLFIGGQITEGDSLGEIATDPINYLGAAFAEPATRFATKGLSPGIAKAMRLGISPSTLKMVSRRFGLPGLALSLGISGYETFDDYRNKRGFFREE